MNKFFLLSISSPMKMNNKTIAKSDKSKINKLKNCGGEVIEMANKEPKVKYFILLFNKWAWQDSNLRPTDYESVALTN